METSEVEYPGYREIAKPVEHKNKLHLHIDGKSIETSVYFMYEEALGLFDGESPRPCSCDECRSEGKLRPTPLG
jgi:hypothetical protein